MGNTARFMVGAAILMASGANAEQFKTKCLYWNNDNGYFDGLCAVTSSSDQAGNYIEDFQAGKYEIRIVMHNRQGQWAQITFNSKPGMWFEQDRYTHHYSPSDLSENLDSTLRGR